MYARVDGITVGFTTGNENVILNCGLAYCTLYKILLLKVSYNKTPFL